jgi:phage N-6-adenine-methyltransferase
MPSVTQISNTPVEARDEWRTPRWLFAWLDMRWDFHVDLACNEANALVHNAHQAGLGYPDMLDYPWLEFGRTGFLNPPYSDIDPWINAAIMEAKKGFTTVMLIPLPNGELRYRDIYSHAAEIIDIVGRVPFVDANGNEVPGNTRGSCIVTFAPGIHGCARSWVLRDWIREQYECEASKRD